jgi:hypothetical protein
MRDDLFSPVVRPKRNHGEQCVVVLVIPVQPSVGHKCPVVNSISVPARLWVEKALDGQQRRLLVSSCMD